MYKLAHLSDLHTDYRSGKHRDKNGVNLREADGYKTVSAIITSVIKHEVDGVLICGDVFHSPEPSIRAIVFMQKQFRRLWKAGIAVYSLTGNHDVNDVKEDIAASLVLNDADRRLYSHAEPYTTHEIADGIHVHMISHHMYGEQADTMDQVRPVEGAVNILSTHGSIIDPILNMHLQAERSPREIVIPDALMSDHNWDYTLLGHIHERGWVGSQDGTKDEENLRIFYNGSAIRRGFSDKEVALGRGWTMWTIGDDGSFTPEVIKIAQRPQMDFTVIDAMELSAVDLTDLVLTNLRSTQTDGSTEFNPDTAPILRQKVINLSAAKRAGMDLRQISLDAGHAMHWELKTSAPVVEYAESAEMPLEGDEPVEDVEGAESAIMRLPGEGSADMLTLYDQWAERFLPQKWTEDEARETISQQARDFVKVAMEEELTDDEV